MFILLLSLFIFAEGTAPEFDCKKDHRLQCHQPEMFLRIPRELEEFKSLCPDMANSMECLQNYEMKCAEENHRRIIAPERYTNIISVLNEICEEGSNLNRIATRKLKCLNETFSDTNCRVEMYEYVDSIKRAYSLDEPTRVTNVAAEKLYCASELRFLSCILEDIAGECGNRARRGAVEFLQRTSFAEDACPVGIRETLLEDIDKYNLTRKQKTFAISELERMKISVTTGDDENCKENLEDVCLRPKLFYEIPQKARVFKALCPELSSYFKCVRDFKMRCERRGGNDIEDPNWYANLIDLFDEICEEGSFLNEVVRRNLKCFNETFSNTDCRKHRGTPIRVYVDTELLNKLTTPRDHSYGNLCLNHILMANCILDDINRNCGVIAYRAVLDILHGLSILKLHCPLDYRKSLLSEIPGYSLAESQKEFAISELQRMETSN